MQEVEELSDGSMKMAAGTMYGPIENLLKLKYMQCQEVKSRIVGEKYIKLLI